MTQPKKVKTYRRGFKKWADDTAIDLRNELGLKPISPLCAFEVCKHLDIPILTPEVIPNMEENHIVNLIGEGSEHWSAATIPIANEKYLIVHNPIHSNARQQSNLMHEIAHVLCEHKVPDSTKDFGLSGFLRNHNEEQENEAEWLGACLQLPRPALIWALRNKMTNKEIAEHFTASEEMVRYRINITGVKIQLRRWKH